MPIRWDAVISLDDPLDHHFGQMAENRSMMLQILARATALTVFCASNSIKNHIKIH